MKNRRRILIVDDEQATRDLLAMELGKDSQVRTAANAEDALAFLEKDGSDIVLVDVSLPGISGIDLLKEMKARLSTMPTVILVTADNTVSTAIEALRLGAYDYLLKPFSMTQIRECVQRAAEREGLRTENRSLRKAIRSTRRFGGMLGTSPAMLALKSDIEKVADTRGTVLLSGESGTGKELAARAIHEMSSRRDGPYVRINCAAIPESLLEAELFGHEKGAFTNAIARREGMFELADGGTLLLDEVTEIDPSMQAKLLRVLQEREITRIGGKAPISVDVRVIATTNRDIKGMVREGTFKEDLYYRLNVIPLQVPPLRERREDIPMLAKFFVERACTENDRPLVDIDDPAMKMLEEHPWQGNVRELENSLERSVILLDSDLLDGEHLRLEEEEIGQVQIAGAAADSMTLREMERELILRRLRMTRGNRTRAAELLGISVRTLRNKINQYRGEGLAIPSAGVGG